MEKEKNLNALLPGYVMLNVAGMIGLSCYILADTFFVSAGVGTSGLAALNLAIPVYSFVYGTGLMLGVGGAAGYSVMLGRGDRSKADMMFTSTAFAGILMAVIYMAAGLAFSEEIALILGADEQVFNMTETYLKVVLLFSPAFILNNIIICFVRNDGNPGLSMKAMILGSLSNIILDYILIFPFKMGILGAVLATGIAPVISLMVLSRHFRRRETFRPVKHGIKMHMTAKAAALGLPSFIAEVASGVVMIVFNLLILSLKGNVGVAAYGIIANISLVAIAICNGVAQGMQPLTSRALGEGRLDEAEKLFGSALKICLVITILIYACIFVFNDQITSVFNTQGNAQLAQITGSGMRIYFTMLPFAGINIITAMFFSSVEKPIFAQLISMTRGFIIVIPAAYIMTGLLKLVGIWMTLTVTEAAVCLMGLFFYRRFLHKPEAG